MVAGSIADATPGHSQCSSFATLRWKLETEDPTLTALVLTKGILSSFALDATILSDSGDEIIAVDRELAQALARNRVVTTLRLSDVDPGSTHAFLTAAGLPRSESGNVRPWAIEHLSLSGEASSEAVCTAVVEALGAGIRIKHLCLEGRLSDNVGIFMASALASNSVLETLKMVGIEMSDRAGLAMAEALRGNTALKCLLLAGPSMGDASGEALMKALQSNTTLERLHFAGTGLGSDFAAELARALARNRTLRSLALEDHNMSDATGAKIARAMRGSVLESLQLICAGLGNETGMGLAWELRDNTSVRQLLLDGLSLDDESFCAFAETLTVNMNLVSVSLQNPSLDLGLEFGKTLANALKMNRSLKSLHLLCSSFADCVGAVIADSLLDNSALHALRLEGDGLGDLTISAFAAALGRSNVSLRTLQIHPLHLVGLDPLSVDQVTLSLYTDAAPALLISTLGVAAARSFTPAMPIPILTMDTLANAIQELAPTRPPDFDMNNGSISNGFDNRGSHEVLADASVSRQCLAGQRASGEKVLSVEKLLRIRTALQRNHELPQLWRKLLLVSRLTNSVLLRRVIAAMGDRGFNGAVFAFFLPPEVVPCRREPQYF